MFITTILFAVYARRRWGGIVWLIVVGTSVILVVEGAFLLANVFKIPDGGWFPLVVGVAMLTLLTTWKTGRSLIADRIRASRTPLTTFVAGIGRSRPRRSRPRPRHGGVPVLAARPPRPPAWWRCCDRRTRCTSRCTWSPSSPMTSRGSIPSAGSRRPTSATACTRSCCTTGSWSRHRWPRTWNATSACRPSSTDYFLGRESVRSTDRPGMARWREVLFGLMARNATDVATYFQLPAERVIEIGVRVDI